MKAFIERLCGYEGSYVNVRWRSLEAKYRSYGCAHLPKDPQIIMAHIAQLDTDWYVTCCNDAGYYLHAVDIDHNKDITPHKTPDYQMRTSNGHRQWIWFLDQQVDQETWSTTQAELVRMYEADRCSLHANFFPRIPYSYNHKRNCEIKDEL